MGKPCTYVITQHKNVTQKSAIAVRAAVTTVAIVEHRAARAEKNARVRNIIEIM